MMQQNMVFVKTILPARFAVESHTRAVTAYLKIHSSAGVRKRGQLTIQGHVALGMALLPNSTLSPVGMSMFDKAVPRHCMTSLHSVHKDREVSDKHVTEASQS